MDDLRITTTKTEKNWTYLTTGIWNDDQNMDEQRLRPNKREQNTTNFPLRIGMLGNAKTS